MGGREMEGLAADLAIALGRLRANGVRAMSEDERRVAARQIAAHLQALNWRVSRELAGPLPRKVGNPRPCEG